MFSACYFGQRLTPVSIPYPYLYRIKHHDLYHVIGIDCNLHERRGFYLAFFFSAPVFCQLGRSLLPLLLNLESAGSNTRLWAIPHSNKQSVNRGALRRLLGKHPCVVIKSCVQSSILRLGKYLRNMSPSWPYSMQNGTLLIFCVNYGHILWLYCDVFFLQEGDRMADCLSREKWWERVVAGCFSGSPFLFSCLVSTLPVHS